MTDRGAGTVNAGRHDKATHSSGDSEDIVGEKWDRCLESVAVNAFFGLVGGGVLQFAFKGRAMKTASVSGGAAFGLGKAYQACVQDFEHPYMLHGRLIRKNAPAPASAPAAAEGKKPAGK